ncbi:hypothetical protein AAG906_005518 [Vitis piasezkii]
MDRLEQRLRQLRTSDKAVTWEDFDGAPVASLPTKFRMPEIERYTGIGCPRIHLSLYSTIMRAHRLDETQMIMFLRQYAFNNVIDVSRRELEALRQRSRSRSPRSSPVGGRIFHEGIARGLWSKSSPSDSKGKKPLGGHRSRDASAISSANLIDQGVVHLVQPSMTTNPLPTHTTHVVPPPTDSMHSIDFVALDDHIHMLIPSILLDNGSTLNVCPLAIAITLGYAPSNFGPSTQTVRAYDSTRREVMGTLEIKLLIGPATFVIVFQVLRIPIHKAGVIPSSLHQKVKFIHDGQVITISHSDDDLFLTGFTFDEGIRVADSFESDHWETQHYSRGQATHGTFVEIGDIVDGVVPHDEFIDEMLAISLSQIEEIVLPELASLFDIFGVSVIEIVEEILTAPALESTEDVLATDDLFDGPVSPLSVGFLSVVEYSKWLANVVLVPKKDGKVRASLKNNFPLPHIDMLVDSTAGHSMLSFMDGFFGYNQILMAPEDMEKTSFIIEWGTYCYRQFRLRLNPKKCTFGVISRKLLGYMVNERGTEVDPNKIRTIFDIRFIAGLTDICEPIFRLLRKSQPIVLDDQCQRAFEMIREYLLSPPVLVPPTPNHPLLLYLSVSDVALECMLAQLDDSGKERVIYYLSKRMLDYETRYVMIERYCLALVWVTHRLRHYMPSIQYGKRILLISPHGDHILRSIHLAFTDRHPATKNIVEYEACILGLETGLELEIRQMEVFGDSNLNQFVDALTTLASMIDIPADATLRPLLIKSRFYHDIYHFLRLGIYPEAAMTKDKRALRQLSRSIRDLW